MQGWMCSKSNSYVYTSFQPIPLCSALSLTCVLCGTILQDSAEQFRSPCNPVSCSVLCAVSPSVHSVTLSSPFHPPEITEMKPLAVLPHVFAVVRFMSFLKPRHWCRFLGLGIERGMGDVLITPPSLTSNSLFLTPMTSALPVLLGSLVYWLPLSYWCLHVGVSLFSILSSKTILSTGSFLNVYLYADCSLSAPPSLTWLLDSRLFNPTAYLKSRAFQILSMLVSNILLSSLPLSQERALSLCRDFQSYFLFQECPSLLYLHGYFLLILRQNFPNYTKFLPPSHTGILSLGSLLSIFIELFKFEIIY